MSKKIQVPEGMLKAAWDKQLGTDLPTLSWDETNEVNRTAYRRILGAALLWMSENPPLITQDMVVKARQAHDGQSFPEYRYMFRVAFLAPQPEIPEELKDLMWGEGHPETRHHLTTQYLNQTLLAAYLRGKASR